VPYQGLNPVQVSVAVSSQGLRPEIPADCAPDCAQLIRECWDQDPSKRPPFSEIVQRLKTMLANLPANAK
jgi:hypothetical protein